MLTTQQQRAVDSDARSIVVIAPAGGGKTQTMAARVARLIRDGNPVESVLLLTFTRAAARNMRERIATLTDESTARRITAGTFHSVCLSVLRVYSDRLGYDPATLEVLSVVDAESLLLEAARDLQYLNDSKGWPKWKSGLSKQKLQAALDSVYRAGVDDGNMVEPSLRIVAHYRAELKRNNCLDFGSILAETNRLFAEHPDVLERYRARFRFVFLDEGHDVDAIQHQTYHWLAPPADMFGILDPRQEIYKWRGSRSDLLRIQYPDAEVVSLAENFRCRAAIVDVANKLIAHNHEGRECEPMKAVKDGGVVRVFNGRSVDVALQVSMMMIGERLPESGAGTYAPRDIAVIARSHRELSRLSAVFTEHGIHHRHVGRKFDLTTTDEFLDLHAAMRLAANPRDNHAFRRLVPRLGIERDAMTAIRGIAATKGGSLWDAACERCEGEWGSSSLGVALAWSEWNDISFSDAMLRLWDAFEVIDPRTSHFWEEDCAGMTLRDALEWYASRDEQDDVPTPEENLVSLLAPHGAKGLEFPVVLIANLNEGTFPTARAVREGGLDEERRCFFVACTRSEDVLLLHYRQPQDQSEVGNISEPSRFLYEMGVL